MQLLLFLPFCGSPLGKERAQKFGALFFADTACNLALVVQCGHLQEVDAADGRFAEAG
jgi:hypothetical protein